MRHIAWRPTLGLLVVLSLVILVEGVVTVGRMVLTSSPPPLGCTRDLHDRSDKWCQLQISSSLTGKAPTVGQVTHALGEQKVAWTMDSGYPDRIVHASEFTILATCHGSGQLAITVHRGAATVYDLKFGCDGHLQPGFRVPAAYDKDGSVYPGPYTIDATPLGAVTAAEYFVQ